MLQAQSLTPVTIIASLIFFSQFIFERSDGVTRIVFDNNSPMDATDQENSRGVCPVAVNLSSNQSENNASDIHCVEKILSDCEPSKFYLLYGTGSIKVIVEGKRIPNTCSLHVDHEVEGGVLHLNCSIPLANMTWINWRKGDALYAIDDLVPYCTRA